MSLKNMSKDDIALLSNKDLTCLIIEDKGALSTKDLYLEIIKLKDLPESSFDQKVGGYYIALTNDKRFVLLDNGTWDLKNKHTTDKIKKVVIEDDEEDIDEDELEELLEEDEDEIDEDELDDEYYFDEQDDDYDDSTDEDLKNLVIIDEDDLELE